MNVLQRYIRFLSSRPSRPRVYIRGTSSTTFRWNNGPYRMRGLINVFGYWLLFSLSLDAQVTVTGAGDSAVNGNYIYPGVGIFGQGGYFMNPGGTYLDSPIYYTNFFGSAQLWLPDGVGGYGTQEYYVDLSGNWSVSYGSSPVPTVTPYSVSTGIAVTNIVHVVVDNPAPLFVWSDEVGFYLDGVGHGFPFAASLASIWAVVMMLRPPRPPGGEEV